MNEKYQELYKFFNTNQLTDLGEDEFFNTYSTDENKYIELYEFLIQNDLTDLNPSDFRSTYFKKKSLQPEPQPALEATSMESASSFLGDQEPQESTSLDSISASRLNEREQRILENINVSEIDTFSHLSKSDWVDAQLNYTQRLKNGEEKKKKEIPFLATAALKAGNEKTAKALAWMSTLPVGDFYDDLFREMYAGLAVDRVTSEVNFDIMKDMIGAEDVTMDQVRQMNSDHMRQEHFKMRYGESEEMEAFNKYIKDNGDTWWNSIVAYVKYPSVAPQQAIRSMAAMLNSNSMNAAAGAIGVGVSTGAAAGAGLLGTPTAGVLALPGAGAGAVTGLGSSLLPAFSLANAVTEMSLSFSDLVGLELDRLGLERTERNILRVLNSDESRGRILKNSATRGGTIAMMDFLGGQLGGRLATNMLKKGAKPLATIPPAIAIEGVAGGAGEATSRALVGQEISPSEVMAEAFGEVGGFALSVRKPIVNAYRERAELARKGQIEINGKLPSYTINGEKVTAEQFVTVIDAASPEEMDELSIRVENDPGMERYVNNKFTEASIRSTIDPSISEADANRLVRLEMQRATLMSRTKDKDGKEPKHAKITQEKLKKVEAEIDAILAKYEGKSDEQIEEELDEAFLAVEIQREIDERRAKEIADRKAELEAEGRVEEADQIEEPQERVTLDVTPTTRRPARRPETPSRNTVNQNIGQTYTLEYSSKGKKVTVEGELVVEGKGDGRKVTLVSFDGSKVFDLGAWSDVNRRSTESLGLKRSQPKVTANTDGSFVVNNKTYVNPNEDPADAITRDEDGNVVNVKLQTEDGKTRTFRGTNADAIAYEITLAGFEDKNQLEQQLEQLENEDNETQQAFDEARASEQVATEEAPADTKEVGTDKEPSVTEREQLTEEKEPTVEEEEPTIEEEEPTVEEVTKNEKVDTKSLPLVREKKTGKLYRKVGPSSEKGVSLYVPEGTEVYVDEDGIQRPSESEKYEMVGTQMGDSMFEEVDEKKISEAKEEANQLEKDIEYEQGKIEEAQEEINIEKGNYKEAAAKIKAKIAEIRKNKELSKEQKEEAIDEQKAALQDLKDDHDDLIQSYKDDIRASKSEISKTKRRLKKLGKGVLFQPAKGDQPQKGKPKGEPQRVRAKGVKDLIDINKNLFGLNDKQAKYAAIIMDRMVGAMALRSGKSKAEVYRSIQWTGTEDPREANSFGNELYQESLTNLTSGISRTMLIDTKEFQKFVKDGRVTIGEKSIHDFDGPVMFHAPDGMFAGLMSKDGKTLIKGDGGVFYPLEFADENYFWASTKTAAKSMVDLLNDLAKKSTDGKVRMALTTGSSDKVFSNTSAARGIMEMFIAKAMSGKRGGISQQIVKSAIANANKFKGKKRNQKTGKITEYSLGAKINQKMSLEEISRIVSEKLDPNNSSFEERKVFVEQLITNVVNSINQRGNKEIGDYYNQFFSDISSKETVLTKGTKKNKIAIKEVKAAIAESIQEKFVNQLFADGANMGVTYAVVEVDVNQKGPTFRAVDTKKEGRRSHQSYPIAIETVNGAKPVVHILKNPKYYYEVANTEGSNSPIGFHDKRIFPTTKGITGVLQFIQPKKQEGVITWTPTPVQSMSDSPIAVRKDVIRKAAADLKNGNITNEQYQQIVSEYDAVSPIGQFFAAASEAHMREALGSKADKLMAPFEDKDGNPLKRIALRLDIPAYLKKNAWVVSVHDGTKKAGSAISYTNAARIKNVEFSTDPRSALNIAAGAMSKSTFARMFGEPIEIPGKNAEEVGKNGQALIEDIVGDPDWVQVGMNPFRHSFFYDRNNKRPVVRAEEVIQVGGLVYAKNVEYGSLTDDQFQVKGVVGEKRIKGAAEPFIQASDQPLRDAEGNPVYFQDARAAMTMSDGRAVIYALNSPDVTSPIHEMAHVFEHYLTEEERSTIMDWAGHTEWTRDTSEAFAEGFEKFLFEGPTETSKLNSIFEKFREWLMDIYNGVVNSPLSIELTPKVKRIYESMVMMSEPHNVTHESDIQSVWQERPRTWFENTMDGLKVKYYDKYWRVFMLQEDVETHRGTRFASHKSFKIAENLMHGRTAERLLRLEKSLQEVVDLMKKYGIDSFDINQYMLALHAEERNEKIFFDQIEAGVEEPNEAGSGMTTEEAREILRSVNSDPATKKKLDDIVKKVRSIQRATQENLVRYGLEDEKRLDSWNEMFENYIPLHGFAVDEMSTLDLEKQGSQPNGGSGLHIPSSVVKKAKGRTTRAANALATVLHQAQATIVQGEKNKALQVFYKMVEENPNSDVWFITDKQGKRNDAVAVRIDGQKKYIRFKNPSHAHTLKNSGVERVNFLGGVVRAITGYLRKVFTTLDPEFIISNFSRDIQSSIFNALSETETSGVDGKKMAIDIFKKVTGINNDGTLRQLLRHNMGKGVDPKMAKYIEDFELNGGKTGWGYVQNLDSIAKDIQSMLGEGSKYDELKYKMKGSKFNVLKVVELVNDSFENSIRLATYITAVESGMTEQEAANMAKEITVNFNRSGESSQVANALYLFFNAGIQGSARMIRTLKLKSKKAPDGTDRSFYERINNAQKLAAGLSLFTGMLTMYNLAASDRDEDDELFYNKIPDYEKERNLILMLNDDNYMKIPLPYGFNLFSNLGESFATMSSGNRQPEDALMFMMNSAISSFSPISFGQSESVFNYTVKAATPSFLKPIVEVALNESYFGNSIYREQLPFMTPKSNADMGYYSPESVQDFFKFMNEAAGGTKYRSSGSMTDFNPDAMWYIFEYMIGGTGRFVNRSGDLITSGYGMLRAGEFVKVEPRDIPFLRKLYGKSSKYYDYDLYRENTNLIDQLYDEYKDKEARVSDISTYKNIYPLAQLNKEVEKRLKILRKSRDRARNIKDFAKRENAIYEIEEKQRKLIMYYNKRYEELRGK